MPLIYKRRITAQPQQRTIVDPALGADFAWVASVGAVVGPAASIEPASRRATQCGICIGSGYAIVNGKIPSLYGTTWTECGVVILNGTDEVDTLSARATGQTVSFRPASSTVDLVIWGNADVNITAAALPVGVVHYVARRDGNIHTVWLNGKLYGSTNPGALTPGPFDGTLAAIGAWAGSGASLGITPLTATNGVLSVVRTPRALSDGQCVQLSTNAWQAFKPSQPRLLIDVVAGGGGSTGTVAVTNAADTSSAAGKTTVIGTLARTNTSDTSSASGTTTVTGSLAKTNANDTATASGAVGANITGTVATTNANDTATASGTTRINASSATTNANDTSSASGTTQIGGTSAASNANDTATASGIAGAITGTVSYTNASDTAVASGSGGPVVNTKIGGDDVPRHEDEERIEVWERMAKTPRRDDTLDKVIRDAYAKATGQQPVVAMVPSSVKVSAAPVTLITLDDEEEEDLEILLLSL